MSAGADHPRMLYRPGTALRVWNAHDVDVLIVADEAAERRALAEGWTRRPGEMPQRVWGDHDRDGKPGGSLPGNQSTVARGRRKKGQRNG